LVALFGTLGFECECLLFAADVEKILDATSIVAPVVLKMDVCRQIPLILGRPFLNTTKSIGMKEFLILTEISSRAPTGRRIN
jgi:hypothetical protein